MYFWLFGLRNQPNSLDIFCKSLKAIGLQKTNNSHKDMFKMLYLMSNHLAVLQHKYIVNSSNSLRVKTNTTRQWMCGNNPLYHGCICLPILKKVYSSELIVTVRTQFTALKLSLRLNDAESWWEKYWCTHLALLVYQMWKQRTFPLLMESFAIVLSSHEKIAKRGTSPRQCEASSWKISILGKITCKVCRQGIPRTISVYIQYISQNMHTALCLLLCYTKGFK